MVAITTAIPAVKPVVTGCGMYWMSRPRRANAIPIKMKGYPLTALGSSGDRPAALAVPAGPAVPTARLISPARWWC